MRELCESFVKDVDRTRRKVGADFREFTVIGDPVDGGQIGPTLSNWNLETGEAQLPAASASSKS